MSPERQPPSGIRDSKIGRIHSPLFCPELVFHATGDLFESMGFELRQADNPVRLYEGLGQEELLVLSSLFVGNLDRGLKIIKGNPFGRGHILKTGLFGDPRRIAVSTSLWS